MDIRPTISPRQHNRLKRFQQRFETLYGEGYEGHWLFLLHAAFPIFVTPDLLYQLWFNFRLYPAQPGDEQLQEIPNIVVSDLILSGLCREVGYELYEIDKDLRLYLLYQLQRDKRLGRRRIELLALFLRKYSAQALHEAEDLQLRAIHQQVALATLNPRQAARQIGSSLQDAILGNQATEQIRLSLLLELLAGQDDAFENLLAFSQRIKANLQDTLVELTDEDAVATLVLSEEKTPETVLTLPVPEHLRGKLNLVSDSAGQAFLEAEQRIAEARRKGAYIIDLQDLGLTHLPSSLWELTGLNRLLLQNNQLREIPEQLSRFPGLVELNLSRNQLVALPHSISQCKDLELLIVHHNQIHEFPEAVLEITALRSLNLGHNEISAVPPSIEKRTSLRRLYLNDNLLTALPDNLGKLKELEVLQLHNNQLTAIPISLHRLANLRKNDGSNEYLRGLTLEGNPLVAELEEGWFRASPQELIDHLLGRENSSGEGAAAESATSDFPESRESQSEAGDSQTELLTLSRDSVLEGNLRAAIDHALKYSQSSADKEGQRALQNISQRYQKWSETFQNQTTLSVYLRQDWEALCFELLEWVNQEEEKREPNPERLEAHSPDLSPDLFDTLYQEVEELLKKGNLAEALQLARTQARKYFNQAARTEILFLGARFAFYRDLAKDQYISSQDLLSNQQLLNKSLLSVYEGLGTNIAQSPEGSPQKDSETEQIRISTLPGSPTLYTLLIGIDQYAGESLSPLQGCANDVSAVSQYLKRQLTGSPYGLAEMILLNEQATRQNVLDAFQGHLAAAQPDDQVLIYFAGYGSQEVAAKEWRDFEPDGLNETLVLHDSRTEGGYDLADKELTLLLSEISFGLAGMTVIVDAGNRPVRSTGDGETLRRNAPRHPDQKRPYGTYFIPQSIQMSKAGLVQMPQPAHYLLSSSQAEQEVVEQNLGGQARGVFTYLLLRSLQQQSGPVGYQELVQKVRASIHQQGGQQSPAVFAQESLSLETSFLLGWTASPIARLHITFDPEAGRWQLNAGLDQGIRPPHEAISEITQLEIFPPETPPEQMLTGEGRLAKGFVVEVLPTLSWVDAEEGIVPEPGPQYPVRILSQPISRLSYYLDFPKENIDQWPKIVGTLRNRSHDIYLDVKQQPDFATYRLFSSGKALSLLPNISSTKEAILEMEGSPFSDKGEKFLEQMVHLSKWDNLLQLRNPGSQILTQDLQIGLFSAMDDDAPIAPSPEGFLLEFVGRNKSQALKVAVYNRSPLPLYCTLLYLGEDFDVQLIPLAEPLTKIPPGESVWALEGKPLSFSFSERLIRMNRTEAQGYFKVIGSPEPFDPGVLRLPNIDQTAQSGSTRSIENWTNTHSLLFDVASGDFREWNTNQVAVSLRRRSEGTSA